MLTFVSKAHRGCSYAVTVYGLVLLIYYCYKVYRSDVYSPAVVGFSAGHNARSLIGYWHHNGGCLSVRLSGTLCSVDIRYIL